MIEKRGLGRGLNALLGEMARENRSKRVIELERRIAEMEEQMAAIGAGGVEPLRKAAATPIAWHVTGCSTMLDEHDAKAEAKRCGGSAKAVPLYTAPPPHTRQTNNSTTPMSPTCIKSLI